MRRIGALATISDEPGKLTRMFASPAMRRANETTAQWMRAAGLTTRQDALGNFIGRYEASGLVQTSKTKRPSAPPRLLLGSHLDTVRNAGKFDGPLGVLLAIACVETLHRQKIRLPFAIEVIGFADEEGVRFQTTYLGSKALAGGLTAKELRHRDANGISLAEAIKHFGGDPANLRSARMNPKGLLGYLEAHIEQGPVLEKKNLALGVVTAIAGQTRVRLRFIGHAGHAGTVPMNLRRDALCAAAEFVLAVEKLARQTPGLVATVGKISAEPGAGNVIPGEAHLTLDVRHANDAIRRAAHQKLKRTALAIAARRKLKVDGEVVHETGAVACDRALSARLALAVKRHQKKIIQLPSGAGHDAAVMAQIAPVAMLFIRCRGGVSHHPDESVKVGDVQAALAVMNDFILSLAAKKSK